MKASGAPKSAWQCEVNILLDLKKKLEQTVTTIVSNDSKPVQNGISINAEEIKKLQEAVDKQVSKKVIC